MTKGAHTHQTSAATRKREQVAQLIEVWISLFLSSTTSPSQSTNCSTYQTFGQVKHTHHLHIPSTAADHQHHHQYFDIG
ncbi:hypothetical protein EX30DRAFT_344271 [Ascodesmis nigricans]|uniref:Uncharacterized protein n=1 Tax=Ascodesmis nigricans TaxID=341454 RepID=A0A4S2MK15_9PEZI|nr:hypothetical protein EX30DRAFT_344271 [Ascodesmis nigricans]